ncbi:unnamed protein product (macronuclear) [Paramecium tetraurelia]|uniref:Uncharacterized protein n=1 Tax=Paramecium tetraurelia TaxID=5888 RepID=A0DMX4_PARTE|nr:uncharacterized protein GSPATT00018596001 [Paramecium tetraurelia]CAK84391.1 unnamed protein product [Paramecium tetraurelia]|eukprot:XP_001451788.1 hypothetical protein (macronuclear) [Paramecium tetraurelia strain d4-2]
MQQAEIPTFQYQKVNQKLVNQEGEEFDYIMEDKVNVNFKCCKFSFTICSIFQPIFGIYLIYL